MVTVFQQEQLSMHFSNMLNYLDNTYIKNQQLDQTSETKIQT